MPASYGSGRNIHQSARDGDGVRRSHHHHFAINRISSRIAGSFKPKADAHLRKQIHRTDLERSGKNNVVPKFVDIVLVLPSPLIPIAPISSPLPGGVKATWKDRDCVKPNQSWGCRLGGVTFESVPFNPESAL